MSEYILTADQSTTSTKVYLIDKDGTICAQAAREHRKYYPQEGWVEHDPQEILANLLDACREILTNGAVDPEAIKAFSLTNQRETVVVWDKTTHQPIYPAIVWQCTRTADVCEQLIKQGCSETVFAKTGLRIDAYFSATKAAWILDHVENSRIKAEHGDLLMGTIDSWLIYALSSDHTHKTDHTNASRTLLYNIHTRSWDQELCEIFQIPAEMLPTIANSDECFAYTTLNGLLLHPIPITGIIGDSQAAFFAQGCYKDKEIKMTVGTGSSMMMNCSQDSSMPENGLVKALGYCLKDTLAYGEEAIVNCNAESLNWAHDELELFDDYNELNEELLDPSRRSSTYFVPALTGLGIPSWNANARAVFVGMQRSTTKKDLIKAVLEGIIYQLCDALNCFKQETHRTLHVDGGISKNDALMQYLADMSGCEICVSKHADLSAFGSWKIAALHLGWKQTLDELKTMPMERQHFTPSMNEKERNARLNAYHKAVRCALVMADEMETQ